MQQFANLNKNRVKTLKGINPNKEAEGTEVVTTDKKLSTPTISGVKRPATKAKDVQIRDRWTNQTQSLKTVKESKTVESDGEQEPVKDKTKELENKQKPVKQPVKRSDVVSTETLSKQNLREFIEELDLGNSKLEKVQIEEYLNNYQELNNNIQKKIDNLYESFLKQNRSAIKHLTFLNNSIIEDHNLINTYFDRIYVLNLDRRPDRWEKMKQSLDKFGIYNYERFSAVDGSQAPHYQEWKHYSKMPLTRHELIRYKRKAIGSAGSWAILKASYRMLRDAKERGFKRILVLQDDLLFHKNFLAEFARVPSYIKNDWKLLYLGATQHNWTRILKSKFCYYPAGTADGAFAVGIDCSIFEELMKEIIKFNMPFDSGPLRTLQERYLYESVVLDPNLIIADIRDSDLRSSRDLVTFGKRFKWDINLYNIID